MIFREISATELPSNALGIKSNSFVEITVGSWVKNTAIAAVGSKGLWIGPLSTPQLPASLLENDGAKMKIVCKGVMGGSDSILGLGSLPLTPLLCSPGEWVDIKGQLSMDKKFSGRYIVSGMFVPQGSAPPKDLEKGSDQGVKMVVEATSSEVVKASPPTAAPRSANPVAVHVPAPVPVSVPVVTSPIVTPTVKNTVIAPVPTEVMNDIAAEKLSVLNHMFEGVQKQNQDLQKKVGGLEEGINKQLSKVEIVPILRESCVLFRINVFRCNFSIFSVSCLSLSLSVSLSLPPTLFLLFLDASLSVSLCLPFSLFVSLPPHYVTHRVSLGSRVHGPISL